jgi:hypothetical protein
MSMNKKEQAEFDAAKKAVIVARALNWSEPVERDIPAPQNGESKGFTFNTYSTEVLFALSSWGFHATSRDGFPKKTSTQRGVNLFSTKLLALKALRCAVEKECAEKLAGIDMQIQAEKELP